MSFDDKDKGVRVSTTAEDLRAVEEGMRAERTTEYPEEMPPRDAARYLHTTERTLHEWSKDGKIAHMRLSPKKIVYRRADLDEYKQSCHVAAKRSPAPAVALAPQVANTSRMAESNERAAAAFERLATAFEAIAASEKGRKCREYDLGFGGEAGT